MNAGIETEGAAEEQLACEGRGGFCGKKEVLEPGLGRQKRACVLHGAQMQVFTATMHVCFT